MSVKNSTVLNKIWAIFAFCILLFAVLLPDELLYMARKGKIDRLKSAIKMTSIAGCVMSKKALSRIVNKVDNSEDGERENMIELLKIAEDNFRRECPNGD